MAGSTLNVAGSAFKAFEQVNSTVAFYMFIIEEAIQSVSMAIYLSHRDGDLTKVKELAQWNKEELINPLGDFANGVGFLGFPMNYAFDAFADASRRSMDYYLSLEEE